MSEGVSEDETEVEEEKDEVDIYAVEEATTASVVTNGTVIRSLL